MKFFNTNRDTWRVISFIFMLFVLCFSSVMADDISEKQNNLKQIKIDLQNKKKELDKSKKIEKKIKKDVTRISTNLKKTINNIKIFEMHLDTKKSDYDTQVKLLTGEKKREQYFRKMLKQELELLYKQKFITRNVLLKTLNLFFLNQNFYREIEKNYNLKTILFYNKDKCKDSRCKQSVIETTQKKIETDINVLTEKKEQNKNKQKSLETVKTKKQGLLQKEKEKQAEYRKQIDELNKSARELENLINRLMRKPQKPIEGRRGDFDKYITIIEKYGKINWPVIGDVIVKYGKNKHPQYDTYRISNGIEIKTDKPRPIKSVLDGKVVYCDKLGSYGNTVILEDADDVYTVYAYLDKIYVKKGDLVQKDALLGRCGISSLNEVYALYFEIRIDGVPMDPERWLK